MPSIGKSQEQRRERENPVFHIRVRNKITTNPTVQSGSRITKGLEEAYHFLVSQESEVFGRHLRQETNKFYLRPQALFIKMSTHSNLP